MSRRPCSYVMTFPSTTGVRSFLCDRRASFAFLLLDPGDVPSRVTYRCDICPQPGLGARLSRSGGPRWRRATFEEAAVAEVMSA